VELTERLARLSASQVSDGLGAAGLPRDGLLGVFPIEPARHIAGRAFTVYFRPAAEAADRKIEYIAAVSPGDVIVLGNHGRLDCSVWGGQRTVGALQRGAAATRDLLKHGEDPSDVQRVVNLHEALTAAADNPLLAQMLRGLDKRAVWYRSPFELTWRQRSWDEHDTIVTAVVAGNAEGAVSAMAAHIDGARQHLHESAQPAPTE
jgi:hypothetical protein